MKKALQVFHLFLFFFHKLPFNPVQAFAFGNLSGSINQNGVFCARKLQAGETWKTTNLFLVRTFEIIGNANKDIKVLTYDTRQIVILSSLSLSVYKSINTDCEGTLDTTNNFYRASFLPAKIFGVDAVACVDSSSLSIDYECCVV